MITILRILKRGSRSAIVFAVLSCLLPGGLVAEGPTAPSLRVEMSPVLVVVHPPVSVSNLHGVRLRVVGPDGKLSIEKWYRDGAPSNFSPVGLADGLYRYEAVAYVEIADVRQSDPLDSGDGNLQAKSRASGILELAGGLIKVPTHRTGGDRETGGATQARIGGDSK